LGRELRAAREAEQNDGQRRVFVLSAEDVAAEVPAYGSFVAEQVARLGRMHPLVRTQFFSEEVDAESGMFPAARRSLMVGSHAPTSEPLPGCTYAFLLDVAGEDEGAAGGAGPAELNHPGRDCTALTVVEVDRSSLADELLRAPTYRVVCRRLWQGERHSLLYAQLKALAESWQARYLVVDATGVGAGLASFLRKALPGRVIPFQFNAASKSKLGWDFLSVVETGRFKDHAPDGSVEQAEFWRQVEACQMEVLPGAERRMRWSVPDGTRDSLSGEPLHDDLLLSAALVALLDDRPWPLAAGGNVLLPGRDPLEDMDRGGF
jgi:hypothetical protein